MSELLSRVSAGLSGRYRIERELGRGGMATVFLAHDEKHHRQVAVKVLEPDLSSTLTSERFQREIEVAGRLTHPHILPLHDSGAVAGLLYYVMPFIDGRSLRERMAHEGPLPVDETLRIVGEIADALDYAHSAGIVHRDIKPENLLFASGHALLSDFGIARVAAAAASDRLTATGLSLGTPAYMSPEQIAGTGPLDGRSDLYSLACVAYEMLGGMPPFTGPSAQAVMARHAIDPVPTLRTLRPTLSDDVDRVLQKALAKVPADRFATAHDFARALTHACSTATVSSAPVRSLARRHPRAARLAIAGAVLLVLTLASARVWFGASRASGPSVAVLPFDNLSGDSAQDYLLAGMQNALVGALGQVGAMRVIWTQGRLARDRLTQRGLNASELARELDADRVVSGSVVRAGDSLKVQVRLFQAEGQLAWSQEFVGDLRDMLSLCGEVARAIARETRTDVDAAVADRLTARRGIDPATYESFLRGMHHLDKQTAADVRRGIQYLEEAVQRDPANPYAYTALAEGYATVGHSPASTADAWQRARAAAERALTLDPNIADAHAVLARVKMYHEYDWDAAEREFRRTFELNPSHAFGHYHYSWYLTLFDRFDEAIAEHKIAQELDPLTPATTAHLGTTYLWAGRPDDALNEVEKVLQRDSTNAVSLAVKGYAYAMKGDFDRAIALGETAVRTNPAWRIFLGVTYAKANQPDQTRRLISEFDAQPTTAYTNLARAFLHSVVGNNDEALRLLEQEPPHAWRPWVRNWPGLEGLRRDPRFPALLKRFDLPL